MWIFTREGFFSVVEDKNYCEMNEIMVRSRVKNDLERLAAKLPLKPGKPIELPNSDYRWRMPVSRADLANYLSNYIKELDYSTVKDTICTKGDHLRKTAYYGVWQAMMDWQSKVVATARAKVRK